jgi:hypothetical protein
MNYTNIFRIASFLIAAMMLLVACSRNDEYGTKTEENGEPTEAVYSGADSAYDPEAAQYPVDKIKQETNLDDNVPLELDSQSESVQKKKLLATLNRHRTNLEKIITDLKKAPGNADNTSTIAGNIEKLEHYQKKIDQEIAKVRAADDSSLEEVAENATAAIKGSGALMQSENIRIQRGY